MLRKKDGDTSYKIHYYSCKYINLSIKLPFFIPKYIEELDNTIPRSKIYPPKNVVKKFGGHFVQNSILFLERY